MSGSSSSFDVRVWSIQRMARKRATTYGVRWAVAGKPHRRTFASVKLADAFRAELLTAVRRGRPFDVATGLPEELASERHVVTWFEHARAYASAKWPGASPNHRRGIAEALTDVTMELVLDTVTESSVPPGARRLLMGTAFVRGRTPTGAEPLRTMEWIERSSCPISDLTTPAVTRRVLERLARRIDGAPAAPSTYARKRAIFHNALEYAVADGHLDANPLSQVRGPRRTPETALDRRVVANPQQAAALLEAARETAPSLEAFFAVIYYAGLRPSEVLALTQDRLELPTDGWGSIDVVGSEQATARLWTEGESTRQARPLKHRAAGSARVAPAPPELVTILRRHLDTFACGRRGQLFVARTGKAGRPLAPPYDVTVGMNTVYRAWDRARRAALSPREYDSPLARRPYDLRHAYVSTWLAAGVSPADIAAQAGHSVQVMLSIYSQQVADQQARNQAAVDAMYRDDGPSPKKP